MNILIGFLFFSFEGNTNENFLINLNIALWWLFDMSAFWRKKMFDKDSSNSFNVELNLIC